MSPRSGNHPTESGASDPLAFCDEWLADLARRDLRRRVRAVDSAPGPVVELGGRRLILLASNNYLGLAAHPRLVEAAVAAARRWGVGTGAARLVTGGLPLHDLLEQELARFKGCPDAVLFSSGYHANVGTIPALVGPGDLVLSDALNHASLIDGIRLSRAEVKIYPHRAADTVRDELGRWRSGHGSRGRVLVVTDSVFSMDGDRAPLPGLVEACEEHGALLMVDEAHATGVVGPGGRGLVAEFGLEGRVPVVMGTLSKALGAAGGFVAGSRRLCEVLRNRARAYIFDTALPAPVTAAGLEGLRILGEEPERVERVRARARALAAGLRRLGFECRGPQSAVVPVPVGPAGDALALARALEEAGVLAPAIRPPTVAEGTSRIRATVTADHTAEHIEWALEAFAKASRLRVGSKSEGPGR